MSTGKDLYEQYIQGTSGTRVFPKLTPVQISRVSAHGQMGALHAGEVLYEQVDIAVPFFVVVSGELEIMRPFGAAETLVTVFGPGQFTGEVNTISGRRTFFRVRASKPGKVIELDRQHMLALMQTDAELGYHDEGFHSPQG